MLLKVCGATSTDEVTALAAAGADLVGLWHGVPGGHAELALDQLTDLAAAAAGGPRPVLVTLSADPAAVLHALAHSGIRRVQLHGYQPPSMVRTLKAAHDLVVVKVLHVLDGECQERGLIPAYTRAGVDVFLLDTATSDGRLGSTARSIDPTVAARLADDIPAPVMLAGGLSVENAARFRPVVRHPRFHGIDVDGGARGEDGRFDPRRIAGLRQAWQGVLR